MSIFSVVATPIGNLEDVTLRALRKLRTADVILCEDTRVTKKLLSKHEIQARTMSYHAHSRLSRTNEVISLLKEGKNVALVSDAGTPGISDPGAALVFEIRKEMKNEIDAGSLKIEAIPGPSAFVAALSIAGLPSAEFTFLGFLPHKKGRETLFREIAAAKRTMVFYESPHRIMKAFDGLSLAFSALAEDGESHRPKTIAVCRELTKVFEEVATGSIEEVKEYFIKNPDKVRGEFVVIVS